LTRRAPASAPAKLNLGLRVVGRRRDGYHLLESVLVPLDLADALRLEVDAADGSPCVELRIEGAATGVPAGEDNLVVRAVRGFAAAGGLRLRVRAQLEKRLPVGSGLGGGSSDAGAALRALSALFPEALSAERLAALALDLGADVPYFLDPRPARVAGIGERIEPLGGVPPLALLLVNPGTPLATGAVFRAFDAAGAELTPPGSNPTMPALLECLGRNGAAPERLGSHLANDLEPAASGLCPAIPRLRKQLCAAGALAVGMSGSGSTLYGVFENEAAARAARERAIFERPAWVRVAKSAGSS
jgi:4-diphosphocytidyl-2-C-methyl-D-erythritol kinase